jgi:hypothetical protein
MIGYDDISPAMRSFIAAFEGFRKLGFKSDDLFLSIAPSGRNLGVLTAFCLLKTQGKEFCLECAPIPNQDGEAFGREFTRVAEAMNANDVVQEDFDRIWQESFVYRERTTFVQAVLNKGFIPPNSKNALLEMQRHTPVRNPKRQQKKAKRRKLAS